MTTSRGPDTVNGTITAWIPLTTPGPGSLVQCSSAIYYVPGQASEAVAFDPYYGRWIDTAVRCLATEQSLWWNQHSDGGTIDINLGPFACPTGYTTASVSTVNPSTSFVGCCPSAYSFMGTFMGAGTAGQCQSPVIIGNTISAKYSNYADNKWEDTTSVVLTTGINVYGVQANGFVFQDQAVVSPASASASTTQLGTTSTSSSVLPSSTQYSTSSATQTTGLSSLSTSTAVVTSNVNGLSMGTKIGIGVGVSVGALGILCLVVAIILLKRRKRIHSNPVYPNGIAEAPSYPPSYPIFKRGVGSNSVYEASSRQVHETPATEKQVYKGPTEMWVSPSQGG